MEERTTSVTNTLQDLLITYRSKAKTEREKGAYFEQLTKTFLENDATYKDIFSTVYSYADWAKAKGMQGQDTGIDLVAETADKNVYAIQCKFYDAHYKIKRKT